MKNQQPDNFFREKLAAYHKPAPAGAWDKIEASLKKTETKFGWWKIAASLLLLSVIAYVLWHNTSNSAKQPITQTQAETESPRVKSIEPETKTIEESLASDELQSKQPNKIADIEVSGAKARSKVFKGRKSDKPKVGDIAPSRAEENLRPLPTDAPETGSHEVASSVAPIKKSSSITLIITAAESEKYLDKNALAEATYEEKKSSTFKKLLKKANDLANNQDPFGDLRVKKNEILALEFKNDKRGQN